MKIAQTTSVDAVVEPVSISEVREHLRLETDREDFYIKSIVIPGARSWAENFIDGVISTRSFTYTLDDFEDVIDLPLRPIDPTSIAITYVDTNGDTQTFTAFDYESNQQRTKIWPIDSWPSVQDGVDKVVIAFTAGFIPVAGEIPVDIKRALLQVIASAYSQRLDHGVQVSFSAAPLSAELLLQPYRLLTI